MISVLIIMVAPQSSEEYAAGMRNSPLATQEMPMSIWMTSSYFIMDGLSWNKKFGSRKPDL